MRTLVPRWVAVAVAALALSTTASAHTSDGLTPSREYICTNAGLKGELWGLCNAYCEAMDCDHDPHHAADAACNSVLDEFSKASGGYVPPCAGGEESWMERR